MPTLYVKNKMAEASLLPKKEGKKFFLGHSRVLLLDFYFQDLGILSRKPKSESTVVLSM